MIWLIVACVSCIQVAAEVRSVTSFETQAELAELKTSGTQVKASAAHATDGRQAVEVTFPASESPEVRIEAASPWDWSGFKGVLVDVTNPGTEPVEFRIRIDDDSLQAGPKHSRQGFVHLAPGETSSVVLCLGGHARDFGMYAVPFPPKTRDAFVENGSGINLAHITAIHFFINKPAKPTTLILDNVRADGWCMPLEGIVDQFGQFSKADWPGKVHQTRDLARQRTEEMNEFKAHPIPPGLDTYGGWAKGPARKRTGFFRTEKIDGKWWLITPTGHLFFSLGMDCVNTYSLTFTEGREKMFMWLPKPGEPLAKHVVANQKTVLGAAKTGTTYNFFTANLERKYGKDYEKLWYTLSLSRLRSWGFNTVANWASPRLYGNKRVPYVITIDIGGDHGRISSGLDYWSRMHDAFDPRFAEDLHKAVLVHAQKAANDPWCLGYFVDNEMSWGGWGDEESRIGLARGALNEPQTCPAKCAILQQLRAKYDTIARFNQAWGTKLAGWEAVNPPFKPAGSITPAAREDMIAFVREFARQYFRTVRDTIRAVDPNHLYLGCRFSFRTKEAMQAAAEFCDVVSFNIYETDVNDPKWKELTKLNKPCIIGEFHIGATDRGMFHPGLVAATNQEQRAAMYRDYVNSVANHPAFVGCHWFEYVDEPVVGRSMDGENYCVGFISVTDAPYPELVNMARETNGQVYSRRWGPAK